MHANSRGRGGPRRTGATVLLFTFLATLETTTLLFSGVTQVEAKTVREPEELTEDTWTRLLEGEWMVDFYAPWCPACKMLKPEWRKFAAGWSDELNIRLASVDVTANPGLSGRFMVSGLPTIYHVKEGVFRPYNGPREEQALVMFIEGFKWRSVEPISWWRSPTSLQMSFVAHSFRISMWLRDLHNYLVDEVGLPYYLSYGLFAVSTVILGILLGLLIVLVMDMVLGASSARAAQVARHKKTDGDVQPKEAKEPKEQNNKERNKKQ